MVQNTKPKFARYRRWHIQEWSLELLRAIPIENAEDLEASLYAISQSMANIEQERRDVWHC
jgi:hypothetical protein